MTGFQVVVPDEAEPEVAGSPATRPSMTLPDDRGDDQRPTSERRERRQPVERRCRRSGRASAASARRPVGGCGTEAASIARQHSSRRAAARGPRHHSVTRSFTSCRTPAAGTGRRDSRGCRRWTRRSPNEPAIAAHRRRRAAVGRRCQPRRRLRHRRPDRLLRQRARGQRTSRSTSTRTRSPR